LDIKNDFGDHVYHTKTSILKMTKIKPFLRWAGGKQWLTDKLLRISPNNIGVYYEPFLGGASFFFALGPENAVLSDSSHQLIETYQAVRDKPREVISKLEMWQNDRETYYRLRVSRFTRKTERAAQFIYLNKTCWNGLYRVNKKGEFNVPFSNNGRPVFDHNHLTAISSQLKSVKLLTNDFEKILSMASNGDLVYFDPPYTVSHSNNGFRRYNEQLFNWEDQKRLAQVAQKLTDKGCYVIVSNAWHMPIIEMYKEFQAFEISRHSILAANSTNRKRVTEALLLSPNLEYK
jgi:DNA adenine methylase